MTANALTEVFLENLGSALDFFDIDYIENERQFKFVCPFHDDAERFNLNIYKDGDVIAGNWICYSEHCEQRYGISLISFIKNMLIKNTGETYSYGRTENWMLDFLGIKRKDLHNDDINIQHRNSGGYALKELSQSITEKTTGRTRIKHRASIKMPAEHYIKRGFSESILDKYDIGVDLNRNSIVVPTYNEKHKEIVGCQYRSLWDKHNCGYYHNPAEKCSNNQHQMNRRNKWINDWEFNTSNYLYNYWFAAPHIRTSQIAILVEGAADVWRLEEAGIPYGLAIYGSSLSKKQKVRLARSGALHLILWLDGDEAGINAANKIINDPLIRMSYRLFFPKIPKGKDVADIHRDKIDSIVGEIIEKCQKIMSL